MFRRMHAGPLVAALACAAFPSECASDSAQVEFAPVDRAVIQHRLELVPRKLADRKAALESLFQEVGCEGNGFAEQPVPHSKAPNLVCTLAGESDHVIVVGGHLDSIEVGMGAVDDWSGAVLLPSLYQSLKNKPRRHRFVFAAFAGEEQGLFGSHEYVRKLPRDDVPRIRAMINLECLGVGLPKVWAHRADAHLLEAFALVASALKLEARGVDLDRFGDDDSHSFLDARIPVLTIHSMTPESLPILHHSRDNLTAIHAEDYYTAYRLAATYLAYLDTALE